MTRPRSARAEIVFAAEPRGLAIGATPVAAPAGATKVRTSMAKRLLDIVVAFAALLLLAPLLLLVALAIVTEDRGPVLFRQRRTGLNGRVFNICKFRSMRVADDDGEVTQAVRGDARTTHVGRVIRKFSIDELPQLLNVLSGDMSLVGPRPHAVAHDASWSQFVPFYAERFGARPGLTGYAQICGLRGEVRESSEIFNRVIADAHYIKTWSFTFDIYIMYKTIPLLFNDTKAY